MKRRVNRINAVNLTGTGRLSFYLRVCAAMAAVCVCAALLSAQSGGITTKDAKAKEAMDAAIKSIGGAGKIGEIKSLVIKGTWSRLPNEEYIKSSGAVRLPPYTNQMEIRILLPGNFVMIRDLMNGAGYRGFSQGELIPIPSPLPEFGAMAKKSDGRGGLEYVGTPLDVTAVSRKALTALNDYNANNMVGEWSRFLLGMLMKADLAPLTISSGSTSGVFTLTKKDGALGEIEFDSKTGYPVVVRYKKQKPPSEWADWHYGRMALLRAYFGEPDTIGDLNSEQDPGSGEIRFQDRFSVDGIMFPRVITTTESDNEAITELRIEEVSINPKLSLKDFEVSQR